jgi:Holliday junction resolvasome RuvABC ATP-dependent DNA helicase subunit
MNQLQLFESIKQVHPNQAKISIKKSMLSKLVKFFSSSFNYEKCCPIMFLFGRSGSGKNFLTTFLAKKMGYFIKRPDDAQFQNVIEMARNLVLQEVVHTLFYIPNS